MNPFEVLSEKSNVPEKNNARRPIEQLGYWGLVPFGFGVIILWLSPWVVSSSDASTIARGTITYAGILAAFMAGMSSGAILTKDSGDVMTYLPLMVAALIAWLMIVPSGYFFLYMSDIFRMIILAIIFGWIYFQDQRLTRNKTWPRWYGTLRLRLTAWVVLSLSAMIARYLV